MGHDVEVGIITRDGKLLFTSDSLKAYNRNHLEGQVFEVMLRTKSGSPYFAYYLCQDYYIAVAGSSPREFGGPLKTEAFRSAVSEEIALFVSKQMKFAHKVDAGRDIVSFSHNRVHTNVLAYVSSLGDWYAIQHHDGESEDATEMKVAQVNAGRATIAQVTATMALSPSAHARPEPSDDVRSENDVINLIKKFGPAEGGNLARKLADEGNIYCQSFMYQAGLSIPAKDRPDNVARDTERYALMAAKGGDAVAQYNYAKLVFSKVDASGDWITQEHLDFVSEAKRWHLAAAEQGLPEAKASYDRIHSAFPEQ